MVLHNIGLGLLFFMMSERSGMIDYTNIKLWEECKYEGCCHGNIYKTSGKIPDLDSKWEYCPNCEGSGYIPIYYTPEEWEKLTGEKLRNDCPVWHLYQNHDVPKKLEKFTEHWDLRKYHSGWILEGYLPIFVIAIPGQPKPSNNWRP